MGRISFPQTKIESTGECDEVKAADIYIVTLTVTDNIGATGTDTALIIVLTPPNQPPIADAGPDQEAIVSETLHFDGSWSYDPDGYIVSYEWDFGDGTPIESGEIVSHAYDAPGIYTVTLIVTDNQGSTGDDMATVIIKTPSEATEDLIASIEELYLPEGLENSLEAPLQSAIDALDRGNDRAAKGKLNAFINHVNAQAGKKKLSEGEADALIEAVERVIAAIES